MPFLSCSLAGETSLLILLLLWYSYYLFLITAEKEREIILYLNVKQVFPKSLLLVTGTSWSRP